jgi:hypothetical protein
MLWIIGRQTLYWTVVLLLVGMLLISGCGGDSGSSYGRLSANSASGWEPSSEFNDFKGVRGIEPVATFGQESDESEREEASAVLVESLTARENADFSAQCSTLGRRGMEAIVGPGKGGQAACVKELTELARPLAESESFRIDTLSGDVAALRVKGSEGFALYHGNDGNDYAMPMEKEDGHWKVGGIATLELPKTPPTPQNETK